MKHFFCFVQICIIFAIFEVDAKLNREILGECVAKKLNAYHVPMQPCFDECAVEFLGGVQNQVQQCFFNKDPNRLNPGVSCVTKDATCYKRRRPRDIISEKRRHPILYPTDYANAETHNRVIRAANTTDPYAIVIEKAVVDFRVKGLLEGYRQCKLQCYLGHHSKNKKKLMGKNGGGGRFRRAVDLDYELVQLPDVDDDQGETNARKKRQAKSKSGKSPDYFQMFLGHCYRESNCKSTDGVANKCMPLFFPKKDPVRFCNCIQQFYVNHIDCDRYNNAGGTAENNQLPNGVANVMG